MEEKAQGAIEYLLIIGAAIIVVAIVILMMTGIIGGTDGTTDDANKNIVEGYNKLNCDLNAQSDPSCPDYVAP